MLAANDETESRESVWRELLMVLAPAVATAIVAEIGQTIRDALDRRADRKRAD